VDSKHPFYDEKVSLDLREEFRKLYPNVSSNFRLIRTRKGVLLTNLEIR